MGMEAWTVLSVRCLVRLPCKVSAGTFPPRPTQRFLSFHRRKIPKRHEVLSEIVRSSRCRFSSDSPKATPMLSIATATLAFNVAPPSAVRTRAPAVRMAESVEMDPNVLDRYMDLPVAGKIQAEYICEEELGLDPMTSGFPRCCFDIRGRRVESLLRSRRCGG